MLVDKRSASVARLDAYNRREGLGSHMQHRPQGLRLRVATLLQERAPSNSSTRTALFRKRIVAKHQRRPEDTLSGHHT